MAEMKPEHVDLIEKYLSPFAAVNNYFVFDDGRIHKDDMEKFIAAIEAPKDAELAKEKRYNAELSTDAEWANDRLLALITFVDYYAETNLGGDEEVPILALGNAIDMLDDAIEVIKGVRQANVLLRERIKELEAAHFQVVTKMVAA